MPFFIVLWNAVFGTEWCLSTFPSIPKDYNKLSREQAKREMKIPRNMNPKVTGSR